MSAPAVRSWAELLVDQRAWEEACVLALTSAGFAPGWTAGMVWDALELHGLNRGEPRPIEDVRPAPANERPSRAFLPASHWQELRDRAQAQLDALNETSRGDTAEANLSPRLANRAAMRAGRRRFAKVELDAARAARLIRLVATYDYKLERARHREAAAGIR